MIKLLSLALPLLVFGCACSGNGKNIRGNGVSKTETREVGNFTSIELDGSFDVHVTCQEKQNLEISGDENILPLVKTEVRNNTLRVYLDHEGSLSTTKKLELTISVENIEKINLSGSGDIFVDNLANEKFSVQIDGSGDVQLSGETDFFATEINGSGNVQAEKLASKNAEVEINGSGDVVVNVSEKIEAEINGSGDISYYGNPTSVSKNINGSGRISKQ
ncbi:DUF2807 domain-containing protein [bacterium]|nr:DUF2807 domain-containing protein [bacterium]